MWSEHPLFGVGLGNFEARSAIYAPDEQKDPRVRDEKSFAPHNIFIGLLAETGLAGLAGFLMLFFLTVKQAGSRYRSLVTGLAKGLSPVWLFRRASSRGVPA
jgi:O-antigen ligase